VSAARRRPSLSRSARTCAGWAVVVAVVALLWPVQLQGHLGLTVVSGHSMDGTYRTGDLLLTWREPTYDVQDVVVYRVPGNGVGHGMHVVHRIIGHADGGYLMQGDNKTTPDQWHPTDGNVVGRPFARVAGGGVALRWLFHPLALALLCGVCVFLLVAQPDERKHRTTPGECPPQQKSTAVVAGTRLPHVVDSGAGADG
jgi:signal peptidase I